MPPKYNSARKINMNKINIEKLISESDHADDVRSQ